MNHYLTIDVGGTYIKYALMTEDIEIIEKGEVPTPKDSLALFEDAIVEIYDKFKSQDIKALCMSAPGKIDSTTGYFYTSGALGYISGINLPDALKDRIPVPFVVENDAKAAALAELWKGSMKGYQSGSVITLGTGIGGSVIIGGKLIRGTTFAAGEFSGISAQWNKKYSESIRWSDISSTTALVRQYAEKIGKDPSEITGRIFFDDVNQGKEEALETLNQFCEMVACGIISLQLILDMQRVAIGGGISKQEILIDTINQKLDDFFQTSTHTPATKPEVVACTFGNDANMIGALYHYLYEIKNES